MKVASIHKIYNIRLALLWFDTLPQKFQIKKAMQIIKAAKDHRYLLWLEGRGIKILK